MGRRLDGHEATDTAGACVIDMDAIEREIAAFKAAHKPRGLSGSHDAWTEEKDKKLLALWQAYCQKDVARMVGMSVSACRDRFKVLMEADE